MTLTLIAELLAGETLFSPGGPVDAATACGTEPFLWDRWIEDQAEADRAPAAPGEAVVTEAGLEGAAAR